MNYWFSSDYHLGHANILKYTGRTCFMTPKDLKMYNIIKDKPQEEQRKFKISNKSLDRMNKEIIKRCNERVKKDDLIFYLGDYCFKSGSCRGEGSPIKADYWKSQFNCKNWVYIKGNHDKPSNSLKTIIESAVIRYGNKWIKLVHSPDTRYIDTKYDLTFCGHVHKRWKFQRVRQGYSFVDIINVGVDVWNFYPVNFNEIMKEYTQWKKREKYV